MFFQFGCPFIMRYFDVRTLLNPRLLAVSLLGFSSGFPLLLSSGTLQAWFSHEHLPLSMLGLFSFVGLPYALKFLWAPLMDYIRIPLLGRRRGWILCTQGGLVLALWLLLQGNPAADPKMMLYFAFVIAFLSASQDVAIDAYRTDILPPRERGLGSAYAIFTYRLATLLTGGIALIYADQFGFRALYALCAVALLFIMIVTCFIPKLPEEVVRSHNIIGMTAYALRQIWRQDKIIWISLLLATYKLGDALALQLLTPFLLGHLKFSLTEIGFAYKLTGFFAVVLGGFLGGLCLTRWTVYRALWVFGLAQAFSNLLFVLLAIADKQLSLMIVAVFIENICSGLTTTALLAWMMSLCHHPYTATQFALFSAIASLGRIGLGPVAAYWVNHAGWISLFSGAFVLSFPGLIVLWIMKREVLSHESLAAH
jgi:PAT family beta-lactamase induction signal transducer AmpG